MMHRNIFREKAVDSSEVAKCGAASCGVDSSGKATSFAQPVSPEPVEGRL